jgi:predicted TIM-barrel fold metal-dependent hydrolase
MEWLSSTSTPLWIPSNEVPVEQLYNTLKIFPDVQIVLSEVHYVSVPWVLPMLKNLHQVNIEISRFVIPDGISKLIECSGSNRILFGSRFPDSPIGPQLYNLEKSIPNKEILSAVCSGNLKRLLNGSNS